MTKQRLIVAIAVVAALGVAAFALTRKGGGGASKPPEAGTRTAVKPGHAADALPVLERLPQQALAYDDDPPGDARLEGQVIDADEQPVGGATVVIDSNPPRELVTEEDGSFAFDTLAPRTYRVEARQGDGLAGPVGVHLSASSEPVVLQLREAARVVVTVTRADSGAVIAGALVELRDLAAVTSETGADGVATLRGVGGGWHTVKVSAPGMAAVYEEITTNGEPGTETHLAVRLRAGVTVAGIVTDGGAPVEGARVIPEGAARWTSFDPRLDGVVTDAKGRWRLAGLPRDSLRFRAFHASYAPGITPPIALADGVDREGVVITLERGAKLRGAVVDASGAPVAGAEVRVATDDTRWSLVRHAGCDASGRFEMTGLPRRIVRVIAVADGSSSAVATVDLASASEVTLSLANVQSISGVVVTSSGEPVPEARVVAEPVSGDDHLEHVSGRLRGRASAIADGAAQFTLTGLEPGAYTVRAIRPGEASEVLDMRPGVRVDAGAAGAKIVVDDLSTVVGKVTFADGSAPRDVSVQIGDAAPRWSSDPAGAFRLEGVPTGKVFVRVDGPELVAEALTEVTLAAGEVTDLGTITVQRGRKLAGVVVDASGQPVAGALIVVAKEIQGDGAQPVPEPRVDLDQVVSGADGRYVLRGIGSGTYMVLADHDTIGRSPTVELAPGTTDVDLTLTLRPTGAVEGFVRIAGQPADAMVMLRPTDATNASFQVRTGPDGSYRLDRLAAGRYMLYAGSFRGSRYGGTDGSSRRVTVIEGKTVDADIDVNRSGVTVVLEMTSERNAVQFGYGFIADIPAPLTVDPHTVTEVRNLLSAFEEDDRSGESREGMIVKDRKIELTNVPVGLVIACTAPLRGDPSDPSVIAELQANLVDWPVYCKTVEITATPDRQTIAVQVQPLPAS